MTHFKNLTLISLITSIFFVGCGEQSPTVQKSLSLEKSVNVSHAKILKIINEVRSVARDCNDGRGLVGPSVALTWNIELEASSYEHSNDLAESNTFDHLGSGTESDITGSNNGEASYFNDRIRANGYVDYAFIGENIAGGQKSIEEAVSAWLASPAHCTNLMEPEFREIGVAVVVKEESEYGTYWTQNFGGK